MQFRIKKRLSPRLEITSLVDVVLMLVMFFVLSSTFVVTPGIKLKLPQAATSAETKEEDIVIVVTEEGQLYFNNVRVSIDQLRFRLGEKVSNNKDSLLIVKADRDAKHGRVVEVLDLAKQLGVSRLAIATEPVAKK